MTTIHARQTSENSEHKILEYGSLSAMQLTGSLVKPKFMSFLSNFSRL